VGRFSNTGKEIFPNAEVVIDIGVPARFHFFAYFHQVLDKIRKELRKRMLCSRHFGVVLPFGKLIFSKLSYKEYSMHPLVK